MTAALRKLLLKPWIADLPILVPCKPLRGLWWSVYPFTSYWRGCHECLLTSFVESKFPSLTGLHAWDIGAHFGYYSLWLARVVGPTGSVHAFEPNPDNFHKLTLHANRNRQLPIILHHAAAGACDGAMTMYAYGDAYDTAGHMPYPGENVSLAPRSWQTPVICLDQAVQRGEVSPPDLIKMDVEGHGSHVLAGAINTIRTKLPSIIAGIHSHEENSALDQQLLPLGYQKITLNHQAAEYAGGLLDVCYLSPRHDESFSHRT